MEIESEWSDLSDEVKTKNAASRRKNKTVESDDDIIMVTDK